jgi:hypothetical protein
LVGRKAAIAFLRKRPHGRFPGNRRFGVSVQEYDQFALLIQSAGTALKGKTVRLNFFKLNAVAHTYRLRTYFIMN